jgi:uncharacterized protein YebE (UPF0316 family)
MQSPLADVLGISPDLFHWVILPILIFIARIFDVSINTMRVIFMLAGRRWLATFMGFFESFIWIVAISQIFNNLGSIASYFAYAGGFASGIWVGMMIENRIAIGNVIVRVFLQRNSNELVNALSNANYRFTIVDAQGSREPVNIVFLVLKRKNLPKLVKFIEQYQPNAFYTIESVKHVSDKTDLIAEQADGRISYLQGIGRRK